MDKTYTRINWQNEPSVATPINDVNLNKMDYSLNEVDNRIISLDTSKADQSDLLQTVKAVTYDTTTGVFTFTFWNGTVVTADLNIEKIPVSFSMSPQGVITMTTADGTQYTADVSELIKTYSFVDSSEIDFTVTTDSSGNKSVTASIIAGSITGEKLQPNYLADCVSAKQNAELAAGSASGSATSSELSSQDSEAWAVGERNGQPVPSTDPAYENNAKWWAQHGTGSSFAGLTDTNFTNLQGGQIAKYDDVTQKWVNTEDEGGLLPHFKITSEAGSTVTVVCPDTSVIVPTQTSSGIWQCDVPAYGVYTVHAVINGDDAVRTVTVDTVKEYVIHDEHYSYTLNVYAPTGSSIIVTDGDDETYTGTGAGSTAVIFALHQASTTYTITVTYDGLDSSTTITSSATTGGSGSKTIEFGTINLTLDEDLIGETVVMTNGTATKSKVADSTSMVFYPNATGNWTISCQYDGETYYSEPNPVVVSSLSTAVSAEISLVHIPEGATVTPTDDIQIWLACAGIEGKSYTTLEEVLADRETFETLIADSNACDYMARSTTWALTEGLVPTMTSNTTPSGVASASSIYNTTYDAYKAFDKDESTTRWSTAYGNSSARIKYQFEESQIVKRVKIKFPSSISDYLSPTTVKLQGSNTGNDNDWHDIADFGALPNADYDFNVINDDSYTYYCIYLSSTYSATGKTISILELQFFADVNITIDADAMSLIGKYDYCSSALLSNATWASAIASSDYYDSIFDICVPKMTSNTAPSGTVSGNTMASGYPAWYAFDRNSSTFASLNTAAKRGFVQYDFVTPKKVTMFSYLCEWNPVEGCNLEISYSDDDSTFTSAGTYRYESTDNGNLKVYTLDNDYGSHRYWKILRELDTHNRGDVGNIVQFYGRTPLKDSYISLVPTMTSNTTPSGECIANTTDSSSYYKYYAFDNNSSTAWAGNQSGDSYIGYTFTNPVIVNRVSFNCANYYGRITSAKIQGSNDGFGDDIHTLESNIVPSSGETTVDITNTTAYTSYRLLITPNAAPLVYSLQFYAKLDTTIIHSAPLDTIYYMDNGSPIVVAMTNEEGIGEIDISDFEEGYVTLYSSVAKDLSNTSNDYSKAIRITKTPYGETKEIWLMPDTIRTLYWFGFEDDNLEDLTSANGWSISGGYTLGTATHNINSITETGGSGKFGGVATKKAVTGTTAYVYVSGNVFLVTTASKTSGLSPRNAGTGVVSLEFNGTSYLWNGASPGPSTLYAFGYEK